MTIFLLVVSLLYALFTLLLWLTWLRMPTFQPAVPGYDWPLYYGDYSRSE